MEDRERERVLNFLLAFSPFLEKCIFFSKRVRSGRDSLIRGFDEEFELFDLSGAILFSTEYLRG